MCGSLFMFTVRVDSQLSQIIIPRCSALNFDSLWVLLLLSKHRFILQGESEPIHKLISKERTWTEVGEIRDKVQCVILFNEELAEGQVSAKASTPGSLYFQLLSHGHMATMVTSVHCFSFCVFVFSRRPHTLFYEHFTANVFQVTSSPPSCLQKWLLTDNVTRSTWDVTWSVTAVTTRRCSPSLLLCDSDFTKSYFQSGQNLLDPSFLSHTDWSCFTVFVYGVF